MDTCVTMMMCQMLTGLHFFESPQSGGGCARLMTPAKISTFGNAAVVGKWYFNYGFR